MVHIINGEIVQDNDPRVIQRRKIANNMHTQKPHQGTTFGSSGYYGVNNSSNGQTTSSFRQNNGKTASPFAFLTQHLEGEVTIPSCFGYPAFNMSKISFIGLGILTFILGWRAVVTLGYIS